jgi:hypothetical protein
MKTNYNPPPKEEKDPVVLKRLDGEVKIARVEYTERLARIKDSMLRASAEQTRDKRT